MLGGRHDAFRHLTNLVLRPRNGWSDQPQYGPLLATLLARATELRHLTLDDCEILELNQRVCRTLVKMPKLVSLDVGNVVVESFKHFKSLGVPALTEIEASFSYEDDIIDAIPVFKLFKDTLRSLDLSIVTIDTTGGVRYPHVHTLSIDMCSGYSPSLLVEAFPSLQHLQFQTTLEEMRTDDEIDDTRWDSIRDQAPRYARWPSLRTFHGSILDLYALGLRCEVDHVGAAGDFLCSEKDAERLRAAVGDVRPRSLCLWLQMPEFDLSALSACLAPARERLTELQLRLHFGGDMHKYPISQINDMLKELSIHNLRVLEINITWEASREQRARRMSRMLVLDEGDTPLKESEDEAEDGPTPAKLDLEAIAYRAVKHSETLRFISISDRWVRRATFEVRDKEGPKSKRKALLQLSERSAGWEEFYRSAIHTA
ncbi:hypothetical protein PsYK624_040430 [Phanerochaete sordida]|uniref:F-box domain-containing protein n=1 Tax=Phanerochaete sordida TaxID=48140 RepID=A0A9P3G5J7_9APHY|nr:hypothetical protein PsYK624_040430 [Phanerochaete sordida]